MRPTQALIDLQAIRHNVGIVRQRVGPDCKIAVVVKADAYGHGAISVSRAALEAGADTLCVTLPQEGAELRRAFPSVPILVMVLADPSDVATVVEHDLTQTVDDEQDLLALDRAASLCGRRAKVHLKVDTGMGRLGVRPAEAAALVRRAAGLRSVELEGIFSHFATADNPDQGFARRQLGAFRQVCDGLADAGMPIKLRHMANSAAVLSLPESHLDMVRPGIMIYGLRPAPHLGEGIVPAMTVTSRIVKLKTMRPGEPVSYGSTYRCPESRRIATIPMGYADGYRRGLSGRFHVIVRGARAPVVGRVCMGMFMVDVSGVAGVKKGDEVLILGRSGEDHLPTEEMARALGTISYEIVTGISRRVPRLYRET